jgi:hypothetical protein
MIATQLLEIAAALGAAVLVTFLTGLLVIVFQATFKTLFGDKND